MPEIPQGTYDLNSLLYNMGFGLQSQGQGAKNFLPEFGDEIYGQDYAYLTDLLKNIIGGQVDPALEKAQAAGERNISRGASEALQSTRERLAGTGVSGANIISDIFRNRADAQGNLAAQVGQMGMSARQAAIQNLLGYNQFAGQQSMAATGASANAYQQLLSSLLQNQQAGEQIEASKPDPLGTIFGSMASAAPYAAIALSDKKFKENIIDTGKKTKDGIPIIEFNYKGNPQRFLGVLAQDVEKVKPGAVVKAVDYNKI